MPAFRTRDCVGAERLTQRHRVALNRVALT